MATHANAFELVLLAAVALCVIGIAAVVAAMRSERLLSQWAQENSLTVTKVSRVFSSSTFFEWCVGMQVMRVSFDDRFGRSRHALVRIGDPMNGLLSSSILVEMLDRGSRLDSSGPRV